MNIKKTKRIYRKVPRIVIVGMTQLVFLFPFSVNLYFQIFLQ